MRLVSDILAGFNGFALSGLGPVLDGQRPLILAPHPDDESLGCGGLIAACCAGGIYPVVVILTDGAASHPGSSAYPPARLARLREAEALRATALLGLPPEYVHFLRHRDTALPACGPGFSAITAALSDIARVQNCGLVIAPWAGDPHCDHQATAKIAQVLAANDQLRLLSYPVWGWLREITDLLDESGQQGWRLDISDYLDVKRQAIAAHESQYGNLIPDAPDGFRLPDNLLAIFDRPFEVFIK